MTVVVRLADPADYPAVSALTIDVYAAYVSASYLEVVGDVAGRAAHTDILVADDQGTILGAVALAAHGGPYADQGGPGDAVFRMLVVAPTARGRGIGALLVHACLERARAAGCTQMLIATQDDMVEAQHLYAKLGFVRGADWTPEPHVTLRSLSLPL